MTSVRLCAVLLSILLASVSADTRIPADALMSHIKFLSSDELAGRGNGSPGLERAAEYIARQFESAGLKPGGSSGWFQPFELVTGLTIGASNHLTIRNGARTVTFSLGAHYFPLSVGSGPTSAEKLPVVFAGYGISAADLRYDDYAGVDVRDKAVLIFSHEPQEEDADSRFNGKAPTDPHSTLLTKAMTARFRGARALLVVSDPSHGTDSAGYTAFLRDPQAEDFGIPVLRVQRDRIEPFLDEWGLDALARDIDTDLKPRSRPLDGSIDYSEDISRTRRTVRNVVGLLPGSDPARAKEAVVVGAHYDHLGLGGRHSMNPDLTGQIHNGADDNASGTAAIVEIARAGAADRRRFPRTTVFVAFAGEELGLLGSARYVANPPVPLEQTVAMVNLDMVGRPRGRIMVSGLDAAPALDEDVTAAAAAVSGLEVRRFQEGAGVGASDDTTFAVKKIPAIGFFSGFHGDYHRPSDDWDRIETDGVSRVATIAFELIARISSRAQRAEYVTPTPAPGAHGGSGDAGSVSGYGPYFGSVPDFAEHEGGVKFAEVRENSPAGKAGLRAGDVLVGFGGRAIRTLYDFTFALREKKPGDEVEVTVMRNGRPLTVNVLLTTRP